MRTVVFASFLLVSSPPATTQQNKTATPTPDGVAAEAASDKSGNVTYGRIKQVQAGQKIVISVENGKDQTYNLSSPRTGISVAEGLAVGDAVKILESKQKNARSVQIVRDVRPDAGQTEHQRGRTSDKKQ